jgi:sortase A
LIPLPTRGRGWVSALPALLIAAGLALAAHGAFIPAKAALAQVLLERAWERTLAGEPQAKPWGWADTWPVAVVEVPRLDARAVVLAEAGGEAMAFGPMKLTQTPAPGAPGVAVIAAHRDTHFAFLADVEPGDLIEVTDTDGVTRSFRASRGEIVRHDNSGIEPSVGPARLALVTCYPFDAQTPGPLRYVLWADLVEDGASA